jgi:hypothetical protein
MRLTPRIALAIVALLSVSACHNDTTPAATTPTATRTTETFSGTVGVGGADSHTFTISAAGNVDVTLTAATPPATVVMGMSIGTPGTDRCVAVAGGTTQTAAGSSVQLSGVASPGTMCVDVHDPGGLSAPVTYTVTVTHP